MRPRAVVTPTCGLMGCTKVLTSASTALHEWDDSAAAENFEREA